MTPLELSRFLSGAIFLGYVVSGFFFWRFYRGSGDRFFSLFAVAFWTLAVERVVIAFVRDAATENVPPVYLLRLAAFLLIAVAVADKNRSAAKD